MRNAGANVSGVSRAAQAAHAEARPKRGRSWTALGLASVVFLAMIATATCIVRLAWIIDTTHPGGGTFTDITVEKGSLLFWQHHTPWTPPTARTSRVIFNRQVEVGFQPQLEFDHRRGGYLDIKLPIAVVAVVVAGGIGGILIRQRVRKKSRTNLCACGYSLAGLTRPGQCPECGTRVA